MHTVVIVRGTELPSPSLYSAQVGEMFVVEMSTMDRVSVGQIILRVSGGWCCLNDPIKNWSINNPTVITDWDAKIKVRKLPKGTQLNIVVGM